MTKGKRTRQLKTGRCADCFYAGHVPTEEGGHDTAWCKIYKVNLRADVIRSCFKAQWKDEKK